MSTTERGAAGRKRGSYSLAAHDIEGVLAFKRCGSDVGTGDADTEADLVVGNVVHPLLVEDVLSADVGGDVPTDGVAHVGGAVGVELTTFVTGQDVDLGKVTVGHDLNVEGGLYEMDAGDGAIGLQGKAQRVCQWTLAPRVQRKKGGRRVFVATHNDTGVVTGLGAVGNSVLLDVTEGLSCDVGAKSAPVIDAVDRGETRDRGLVDGGVELGGVWVGGTVLVASDDTDHVGVWGAVLESGDIGGAGCGDLFLSGCGGGEGECADEGEGEFGEHGGGASERGMDV